MGNIVLLDDLTINKIAAGEVIERPASVVKELVENSIDAGAKNITVEIKKGGISLIKITDDGCGIAEDDLEIAFERHATSKIRKAEDLEYVRSMGFRGEALASVASISKVEMISKKEGTEVAHKIIVEGGKTLELSEAARNVGTTITVQNLFYNTPVRYKFLKRDYTEAGYIEEVVTRIALVNKNISIKLISDGKTIVQTNGNGDLKTVIYSIFGKDIALETIEVNYEYEGIRVSGVIGKPVTARGNRSNQLFFLNGRYIKDKNLTAAADQAYKGMIPIGRYGFIVLNLEMDPKFVDVNVHPAKLEVRFEEEGKVFKAVYHAIKSFLAQSELIENVERQKEVDTEETKKIELDSNFLDDERKNVLSGLFKKILKDNDDITEEMSNNTLEEVFKYRQSLKNNATEFGKEEYNLNKKTDTIDDIKISDISDVYSKNKIINDDIVDKKMVLGNTVISSDTKELDINVAEELKKELFASTQKLDSSLLKGVPQDTVNISNEELSSLPQDTVKIENESLEEKIEDDNVFAVFAEKMVEEKLNLDNTQMIDTGKIRDALRKEKIESNPEFNEMYKMTFGTETHTARMEKEKKLENKEDKIDVSNDFSYAAENMNVFEGEEVQEIPYKFLGIAFSTYIIVEIKNEMYIIDQHAAHERIMYEKVKANYYNDEEKDEQFLLLPDVISLTHKEMIIAKENTDMFKKAGFSFEEFGENTIKLTGVPSMCEELNTKQLFLDILDEIDTVAVTARQEKEDKFIATIACKAAVKGRMKLDEQEVKSLMKKLLELPNPFTCPHGRPTAIKMTESDLEKKFSRRK